MTDQIGVRICLSIAATTVRVVWVDPGRSMPEQRCTTAVGFVSVRSALRIEASPAAGYISSIAPTVHMLGARWRVYVLPKVLLMLVRMAIVLQMMVMVWNVRERTGGMVQWVVWTVHGMMLALVTHMRVVHSGGLTSSGWWWWWTVLHRRWERSNGRLLPIRGMVTVGVIRTAIRSAANYTDATDPHSTVTSNPVVVVVVVTIVNIAYSKAISAGSIRSSSRSSCFLCLRFLVIVCRPENT